MRKFKSGDIIYFSSGQDNYFAILDKALAFGEWGAYILHAEQSDTDNAFLYDFIFKTSDTEYIAVTAEEMENAVYIPEIPLKKAQIEAYFKGELSLCDLTENKRLPLNFSVRGKVSITPENLLLRLKDIEENLEKDSKLITEVFELAYILKATLNYYHDEEKEANLTDFYTDELRPVKYTAFGFKYTDTDDEELEIETNSLRVSSRSIITDFIQRVEKKPSLFTSSNLSEFIEDLEYFTINRTIQNIKKWNFSDREKERFIKHNTEGDYLKDANPLVKYYYKNFVNELVEKDNLSALKIKGYACYGSGNPVFESDWNESYRCFSRYYELNPEALIANTLGYFHYYGRITGEPDYEKAYKFFSVAAFAGYYQSMYKIGDMFRLGQGVPVNSYIANKMYSDVYNMTFDDFRQGRYDYEFADAALRLGDCYREGIACNKNYMRAYLYYLQAELAINKRMEVSSFFGNKDVKNKIMQALMETRAKLGERVDPDSAFYEQDWPWLMNNLAVGGRKVESNYKRIGADTVKFNLTLIEANGDRGVTDCLVTIPELSLCELKTDVNFYAEKVSSFWSMYKDTFYYSAVSFNPEKDRVEFYMGDELVAHLSAEKYVYRTDRKTSAERLIRFAAVSFESGGKTYNYICEDEIINTGDKAIVDTADGEKEVLVESIFVLKESELILPFERYREIKRKA